MHSVNLILHNLRPATSSANIELIMMNLLAKGRLHLNQNNTVPTFYFRSRYLFSHKFLKYLHTYI